MKGSYYLDKHRRKRFLFCVATIEREFCYANFVDKILKSQ